MSSPAPHITTGSFVEYLQDNQPILGCVVEETGKHLRILNLNKRTIKLSVARILPWSGPTLPSASSRQEILDHMERHHQHRLALQAQIDPLELWELTHAEVSQGSVSWLAGLLWTDPGADEVAALGRALLQHKAHFKFQPPKFVIYDQAKVEANLAEIEARHKRQRLVTQGQEFCKALWKYASNNQGSPPEDPDPDVAQALKELLLTSISDPEHDQIQGVWKEVRRGLPEHPHLPLLLAQAWGLVPKHYNALLDQVGYSWGDEWAAAHAQEISRQQDMWRQIQKSPEEKNFISIDSSTTRDMDDAFYLEQDNGEYRLVLALACPALTWDFESELNAEVAQRMSSLYLPEGTSHMLPENIGLELYSLWAGTSAPALVVDMRLDEYGTLLHTDMRTSWVQLADNLTYPQVEDLLDSSPDRYGLEAASKLARRLRDQRIAQGAVILEQTDPDLHLQTENGETVVCLESPPSSPRAQLIVSEFMILVNTAVARWAQAHDLPLIHRTQDIHISKNLAGEWEDPVAIYEAMRSMSSSKIDVSAHPHASLGVKAYAPISSALRRYPDLVNVGQIHHFLQHGQPLWPHEELAAMLPQLSARLAGVSKIQRFRSRYWKLLYFQRWCKEKTWTGVIVAEEGHHVAVCLPEAQIFLRGPKHLFGDKIVPGAVYRLELGKIDPLTNDIKILKAREEE